MACSDFVKTFTQLYNMRCLLGRVHDKIHNAYKPWFINGLVNTCKRKNNLYKNILHVNQKAQRRGINMC